MSRVTRNRVPFNNLRLDQEVISHLEGCQSRRISPTDSVNPYSNHLHKNSTSDTICDDAMYPPVPPTPTDGSSGFQWGHIDGVGQEPDVSNCFLKFLISDERALQLQSVNNGKGGVNWIANTFGVSYVEVYSLNEIGDAAVIVLSGTRSNVMRAIEHLADNLLVTRDGGSRSDTPDNPSSGGSKSSNLSMSIVIPKGSVGRIIGRNGRFIKDLQSRSHSKIEIVRDILSLEERICRVTSMNVPNIMTSISILLDHIPDYLQQSIPTYETDNSILPSLTPLETPDSSEPQVASICPRECTTNLCKGGTRYTQSNPQEEPDTSSDTYGMSSNIGAINVIAKVADDPRNFNVVRTRLSQAYLSNTAKCASTIMCGDRTFSQKWLCGEPQAGRKSHSSNNSSRLYGRDKRSNDRLWFELWVPTRLVSEIWDTCPRWPSPLEKKTKAAARLETLDSERMKLTLSAPADVAENAYSMCSDRILQAAFNGAVGPNGIP